MRCAVDHQVQQQADDEQRQEYPELLVHLLDAFDGSSCSFEKSCMFRADPQLQNEVPAPGTAQQLDNWLGWSVLQSTEVDEA